MELMKVIDMQRSKMSGGGSAGNTHVSSLMTTSDTSSSRTSIATAFIPT
jgi:hypothetical protein